MQTGCSATKLRALLCREIIPSFSRQGKRQHMVQELWERESARGARLGEERLLGQPWERVYLKEIHAARGNDKIRTGIVPESEGLVRGKGEVFYLALNGLGKVRGAEFL